MTSEHPVEQLAKAAGRSVFGTDPDGYHAGRVGYPDDLYDGLFARCAANPDILEIAAGTGLATEALLARNPASLLLVEADPELAVYLAKRFADPRVRIVNGAFPDTPFDGKFDLAITAAAFHWMEPSAALARVRQVLRPGGVWSMWWNSYRNPGIGDVFADATVPLLDGIALPPSMTSTQHYSLDIALHTQTLLDAGFIDIQHHVYRLERVLDAAQVRALYASYSFVRALPENQRIALLDRLTNLVETEFAGKAPNFILTAAYSATTGKCR